MRSFDINQYDVDAPGKNRTFRQFADEFISYSKEIHANGTVALYQSSFDNFHHINADIPLKSINPRHFDLYKVHRLRSVSPVTVNIELRCLKSALNTAVRWELIEKNPFHGLKLAFVAEKSPTFFSKADLRKLISTVKEQWLREIIIFAILTGLRRNEILHLRWEDVSLDQKTINIQSSPTFKTKNGKRRTIPLNDIALVILQAKYKERISDLVFVINGKPIQPGWLTHKFKYYVYLCRFKNDSLHFHSLRHTFASWLVQEGVSIYAIKELLGHSDIKMTQVYAHLQLDRLHSTVNKLQISLT